MDQSQQEQRQAAARVFMESLEQLEQRLQSVENNQFSACPSQSTVPAGDRSVQSSPSGEISMDLNALEEAAADIEQFMQARSKGE